MRSSRTSSTYRSQGQPKLLDLLKKKWRNKVQLTEWSRSILSPEAALLWALLAAVSTGSRVMSVGASLLPSLLSKDAMLPMSCYCLSKVDLSPQLILFQNPLPPQVLLVGNPGPSGQSTMQTNHQKKQLYWGLVQNVYERLCKCYKVLKGIVPIITFFYDLFLFTVYECFTYIYVLCTTSMLHDWGGLKSAPVLLELELRLQC